MKSVFFMFSFLCWLLTFARIGGAVVTEIKQEKVSVQLGMPLWLSHVPRSQLTDLIGHHAEMRVSLVTRPGLYGQNVNYERVLSVNGQDVDRKPIVTKNTYAFSSPCVHWPNLLGVEHEVMSGACCFSRPRTITVPQYVTQQVVINVVGVLKSPVEACPARSGAGRKDTLNTFVQELEKNTVVTHVVHYDFKRSGNAGIRGVYPMMKHAVLGKSMHDRSPSMISSRLSRPAENSVHLFHLMQHEMPIKPLKNEGSTLVTIDEIDEIDDSHTDDVKAKQTYQENGKPGPDEISEVYKLIEQGRPALFASLKGGSTMSCPEGGAASPTACYQDDLLGTDCSTTILKISVRRPSGITALGMAIVPGHEKEDVVIFFEGSDDDDHPSPDDGFEGVTLTPVHGCTSGPTSPAYNQAHHQYSLWSIYTTVTLDDDQEGELVKHGGYRGSYRNMKRFKDNFDRGGPTYESFHHNPCWDPGGGGGGLGGGGLVSP